VKFAALPPVRRSVALSRGEAGPYRHAMEQFFGGRPIDLYASGTAALARSITECAARSSTKTPEVILPAYGCPDLITACVSASVLPRLVDSAPGTWTYSPEALCSNLSPNTVAIVAVNLLGIGDDSAELSRLCRDRRIPLIQDSAQFLPRAPEPWPGQYIVLSFGRGKPLSLLHGGALVRTDSSAEVPPTAPAHYSPRDRLLASRPAAVAFNALTDPHLYWLLLLLPGTGLGEVAYKPLRNSAPLPDRAWRQVGKAFDLYRRHQSYSRAIWDRALAEWSRAGIEVLNCRGSPPSAEPLRLPLLAPDRAARDELVTRLNRAGLGASRLYGTTLDQISGIPEVVRTQGPFRNATALADRLFTIPTHTLVTAAAVAATRKVVSEWHRSARRP